MKACDVSVQCGLVSSRRSWSAARQSTNERFTPLLSRAPSPVGLAAGAQI